MSFKLEYSSFNTTDIDEIVGESKYINNLKNIISSLISKKTSILICGERGTGKKQIARIIHAESNKNNPDAIFICFNCILKDSVLFDELYLKLQENRQKNFEQITIYFENIESLSFENQKKLYSLLKNCMGYNYRFIFSSQNDLELLVEEESFDKNLYFIISTVLINTVSLEYRKEDILSLTRYFFNKYNNTTNNQFNPFSEKIEEKFVNHFWRGNVAELKLCIKKAFLTAKAPNFTMNDLGFYEKSDSDLENFIENQFSALSENEKEKDLSLKNAIDNFKKEYVTKVLEDNNWNQTKTANVLGIQRTYVIKLINDLNIRK